MFIQRCVLPLAILLAAPILGAGNAVLADFVLDVSGCVDVLPGAKNTGSVDLNPVAACSMAFCKSDPSISRRESQPRMPCEPRGSQNSPPVDQSPIPFGPSKPTQPDPNATQGMGGTSNDFGAGTVVYGASLSYMLGVVGPELTACFFARDC